MVNAKAREFGVFGPRGEAKTIGALCAMNAHAERHASLKFKLPVPWLGVTDYHRSHKDKTVESLQKDFWEGAWTLYDDDHLAICKQRATNGKVVDAVKLHLFGIEDQGALDRVRRETCGLWVEEPAPATTGPGVSLAAWLTGMTSQRIPTYAKVAMFTTNYPDEDNWTWQRFSPGSGRWGSHPDHPERMWFRVPKGDNKFISELDRREWAAALEDRPDLARRLLEGKPGSVALGKQVAVGFDEDVHVSRTRLIPVQGEPLAFGQDGGLCPATIIGQNIHGEFRVYAALMIDRGGMRQQWEQNVMPWLVANAPWAISRRGMIYGCYDQSMPDDESDSDRNPMDVIDEFVDALWEGGPIDWESRKGALITGLNRHSAPGKPALVIDPVDGRPLAQALSGRWYYAQDRNGSIMRDIPKKPNHPWEDLGDAFVNFLCAVMPETRMIDSFKKPIRVETGSSVFDHKRFSTHVYQ